MSQSNGDSIPNLWPSEHINVSVLSPAAILKTQAGLLSGLTKGLLVGEVTTVTEDQEGHTWISHQFDVIVPALAGYRRRILRVTHGVDDVYPATIRHELENVRIEASTQDEFVRNLREILKSRSLVMTFQSMIARSNDVQLVEEAA